MPLRGKNLKAKFTLIFNNKKLENTFTRIKKVTILYARYTETL